MSLIGKILTREEFVKEPPVLMDIGASGAIHKYWSKIAKYSVCIAFDADDRDFRTKEENNGVYKKLFVYNRLVTDRNAESNEFYLTKSPHCSSLLPPHRKSLENWAFSHKFEVEKKVQLKSVGLPTVLKELNITRIDWYKSDSQGIDLKLFRSLDQTLRDRIIIAEFEPGILDAYQGEDKLHHILSFMDKHNNFWLSQLELKGTQRIQHRHLKKILGNDLLTEVSPFINKIAPGWGEMVFINTFENNNASKRDLLLGWVLATLQRQHGFAYQLALGGIQKFNDPFFNELSSHSAMKIRMGMISLKYLPLIFRKSSKILKRMKSA